MTRTITITARVPSTWRGLVAASVAKFVLGLMGVYTSQVTHFESED